MHRPFASNIKEPKFYPFFLSSSPTFFFFVRLCFYTLLIVSLVVTLCFLLSSSIGIRVIMVLFFSSLAAKTNMFASLEKKGDAMERVCRSSEVSFIRVYIYMYFIKKENLIIWRMGTDAAGGQRTAACLPRRPSLLSRAHETTRTGGKSCALLSSWRLGFVSVWFTVVYRSPYTSCHPLYTS